MPVGPSRGIPGGPGGLAASVKFINVVEINGQDSQAPQEIWYFHRDNQNQRTTIAANGVAPVDMLIFSGENGANVQHVVRIFMENTPDWTGDFRANVDNDYVRFPFNFTADTGELVMAGRIFGTHVETFGASSPYTITAVSFDAD